MQFRILFDRLYKKTKQIVYSGEGRSGIVKRNILGSFMIKGISIIVSLLLVPITIGYVNAELYGVWLTVASVMTWLHFLDLGFTQGLKNRLTEALAHEDYEKGKSLISTTYLMLLVIFIPVCLILEFLIPLVNWTELLNVNPMYSNDVNDVMHVVVAIACIQMVVNVIVSVIAAFQKVALSNSFSVIGNILALLVILVLRKTYPPSLIALALTLAAMPTLVTIIATFICFNKRFRIVAPGFKYVNACYIKDLFSLGYKFFIINIQVLVLYWSTNVLISHVSSPIEVTRYSIAYQLLSVAMMAYTIIMSPLWPAYTDAYARGDYDWMRNTRRKMEKILLLSVFGCMLLVLLSQPIYKIWIGNKVSIPNTMTILVAMYVTAYCWMNLNGTLIVGMGKLQIQTYMCVLGMLIHIPMSLFISNYYGAYGVVISLFLINLAYAVTMNIQVRKLLNRTASKLWDR